MGIADLFSAVKSKIQGAASTVGNIIQDFGKSATTTISSVVNTVGNFGGKIIDKGTSVVNNVVSTAGSVLNTGISTVGGIVNTGGGLINKGITVADSIGSNLSLIPLAAIGVGGPILYSLINNAKPVGESVATVANAVGPYVAMAR